jgi:alkanesulfonate monooxygenase SsuD/methylene tetrahydromethanopterin reductase-like flavin-dependent oxidoreductase (luciferase family)
MMTAPCRQVRAMKRQLHLNLFIHSRRHHEASWRHPASSPLALTDIRYYQDLARRAEAALFDSIFLADQLAFGEDVAQAARTWLERIGLPMERRTVSTSCPRYCPRCWMSSAPR